MRLGPATRAASFRGFLLCLCHRCAVDDRLGPTALQKNAAFAKASYDSRPCDHEPQLLRWPASPLLIKGAGRRPQRPGNQSRIRVSGVPAGSAAIIRHSGLSRFRFTHSQPERCAPQYKSNPRLCRTCGRSAFLVEERGKLRKIRGPRRRCSASAAGRCAFQVTLEVVFCEKWGLYFPNRVWRPSPWAREGHRLRVVPLSADKTKRLQPPRAQAPNAPESP